MTRLISQKRELTSVSDRETQRFIAGNHCLDTLEHVLERSRVHYLGGRIADFFHHDPDSATALVSALATAHVRGFADAWQRRDWPVQHAYYVPDTYRARFASKEIAAALALLALEQSLVLELEQYKLQELARYPFALRQIRYQHRPLPIFFGQNHHRLKRIFRLLRKHSPTL